MRTYRKVKRKEPLEHSKRRQNSAHTKSISDYSLVLGRLLVPKSITTPRGSNWSIDSMEDQPMKSWICEICWDRIVHNIFGICIFKAGVINMKSFYTYSLFLGF